MAADTAIFTIEDEYETVHKLSNGTTFNDLEWPLNQISRVMVLLLVFMQLTRDMFAIAKFLYDVDTVNSENPNAGYDCIHIVVWRSQSIIV